MTRTPVKIGVAGTHSTGKSSFVKEVAEHCHHMGLRVAIVSGLAVKAAEKGFPILRDHTYESTLWIIALCMQQEAEATLRNDVILVDRPVLDAMAYLEAALHLSGRTISECRLRSLQEIVAAHANTFDMHFVTQLDATLPLGEGRDTDDAFRRAVCDHMQLLAARLAIASQPLTTSNVDANVRRVVQYVEGRFPHLRPQSIGKPLAAVAGNG